MTQSRAVRAVAVAACLVGLVGFAVFGWEFGDGIDSPIALALGLAAAAFAVVVTIRDRL